MISKVSHGTMTQFNLYLLEFFTVCIVQDDEQGEDQMEQDDDTQMQVVLHEVHLNKYSLINTQHFPIDKYSIYHKYLLYSQLLNFQSKVSHSYSKHTCFAKLRL